MTRWAIALLLLSILPALAGSQEPPQAQAPPQARQTTHEVVEGETLWALAERYLGNPYRWSLIFQANADKISDPDVLEPGQVLVIPGLGPEAAQVRVVSVAPAEDPAGPPTVVAKPHAPLPSRAAPSDPKPRTVFYSRPASPSEETDLERTAALATPEGRAAVEAVSPRAVPPGLVYSAEWLTPPGGEVGFLGRVTEFLAVRADRTPRGSAMTGETLRVRTQPGVRLGPGDLLQTFHITRRGRELGSVQRPTGMLVVTGVEEGGVLAAVSSVFGRIREGERVRLAPEGIPGPDARAVPVQSNVSAMIVGFAEDRQIQGFNARVFLDVGAGEGIVAGDVFRAYVDEPGVLFGREAARLEVVLVEGGVSTARIVGVTHPGLEVGNRLRLIAKMR